ncbi:long-chain fatty acid transport protein 4 [Neocloeon triangulifer]|uniref:long-chain fatty acid transport protein 4 n=1 Tax=Neocloeon triangulifer TaxID=2078957 RepID=UPI00286EC4C7|nr:long-chain fatty acid transport protein 4 [Neocloeon triangulifer]
MSKVASNNNKKEDSDLQEVDLEIGEQRRGKGANGSSSDPSSSSRAGHSLASKVQLRRSLQNWAAMAALAGIIGALAVAVALVLGWLFVLQLAIVAGVAWFVAAGGLKWAYVAIRTAPRDMTALFLYLRLKMEMRSHAKANRSVADIFNQQVLKHPNKVCLVFEDQKWTFKQVEDYSIKISKLLVARGYKHGDVVAILANNRPEYVALWLGMCRIGVIAALINTNLRKQVLKHSIGISNAKALIYSSDFAEALADLGSDGLPRGISLIRMDPIKGPRLGEVELEELMAEHEPTLPLSLPDGHKKAGFQDPLVYIYTSGTTGMPKAAIITHSRFIFMVGGIHWLAGVTSNDRLYVTLPLYHTAGGVTAIGQALVYGSSVAIRGKFSASAYFKDCAKYECTVGQYIGEMCRYLLAVPPSPQDTTHPVRMMYGNGLRPQIWIPFTERFNIARISEFYGATEGNANIINPDNTVGAIGFVSRIIPSVYPISIIRVDPETGDVIRDAQGLCIPCKPGEPGVFIGKIVPNDPIRAFLGYVDKSASEKKIVRDVFKLGDSAFLSGDILEMDEFGYLSFKDRTGDTYRWKGENVSTSEVEAVISNLVSYRDAIAYGVEVPGAEGRAGMVAIHQGKDAPIDLEKFAEGLKASLPSYARPIFVRLLSELDLTGTFKLKKTDLQKEGFEPKKDPVYYLASSGKYELITDEVYEQINMGKVRL